jgi:CRISPR-associated protein Cas5d
MKNQISFKVYGRYALFTDPVTKLGGEKCSYHLPTYEALKGITKSIYWKPTFTWVIDRVRVMKRIRTESKNVKPLDFGGGNTLAIYNYLSDVEYQVQAHFEWNKHREDLADDRSEGKHFSIAKRMVDKGGRRDICLGARECQAYVEPCKFGEEESFHDDSGEIAYGLTFHGFDYPDETGVNELHTRFWHPKMTNGIIDFPRPESSELIRKFVREMNPNPPKSVGLNEKGLEQ